MLQKVQHIQDTATYLVYEWVIESFKRFIPKRCFIKERTLPGHTAANSALFKTKSIWDNTNALGQTIKTDDNYACLQCTQLRWLQQERSSVRMHCWLEVSTAVFGDVMLTPHCSSCGLACSDQHLIYLKKKILWKTKHLTQTRAYHKAFQAEEKQLWTSQKEEDENEREGPLQKHSKFGKTASLNTDDSSCKIPLSEDLPW